MTNVLKFALGCSMLTLGATAATAAPAVLVSGLSSMGVGDNAGLGALGVGLARAGLGDAVTPGCLCEGWGTSGDGNQNNVYGLSDNFASSTLVGSTVTTNTTFGTTVTHTYSPVAGTDLFQIDITITNNSGAALASNRYARTLDWDVPPGHFSDDFTTVFGPIGGNLIHTSFNPFAPPNPLVTRATFCGIAPDTNAADVSGDCGGYFIFEFGALADGASRSFTTIIGSAEDSATLLRQFGALSVEAYHFTRDNDGPTVFGYGFVGVGLPPIDAPTPASIALFGLGFVGIAAARRRRA